MLIKDTNATQTDLVLIDTPIDIRSPSPSIERREFLKRAGSVLVVPSLVTPTLMTPYRAHAGILDIVLYLAKIAEMIAEFFADVEKISRALSKFFARLGEITRELEEEINDAILKRGQQPEGALGIVNVTPKAIDARGQFSRSGPVSQYAVRIPSPDAPLPERPDLPNPEQVAAYQLARKDPASRRGFVVPVKPETGRVGLFFPRDELRADRFYGTLAEGPSAWTRNWDAQMIRGKSKA